MSLRKNARYAFGLKYLRVRPLNDDLSQPAADNLIGGAGPFDYSGVDSVSAAVLYVKADNGDEVKLTVNVDDKASDNEAVTVDELVTAISDALTTASLTDITASKDSETKRIKLAHATADEFQVWGEVAEIARFGQGHGMKILTSNTMRTFSDTPVRKDGEGITTTDAWGLDTEVMTDGYYKGFTASLVDTAEDWELLALLEGTPLDKDGNLSSPVFGTKRPFVMIEAFYDAYASGQHYEGQVVGHRKVVCYHCKGMGGEKVRERAFSDDPYTIEGITWVDETGEMQPAWKRFKISLEDFIALDIENV